MLDVLQELDCSEEDEVPFSAEKIYIQPPGYEGVESGEDDGDECGGIPDNVCPEQLKGGCELVINGENRVESQENGRPQEHETDEMITSITNNILENGPPLRISNESLLCSSNKLCRVESNKPGVPIPLANKNNTFTWNSNISASAAISIFPETNYEDCRLLQPHALFEKFFTDDLLMHICECSNLYATYHQKRYEKLTIEELRVFIGILIVTGYSFPASFRNMWSSDNDLQNQMVFNAMRRNRFQEIHFMLHFESSLSPPIDNGERNDKLWKLRPLTDHIKAKMLENFHPEQNLSYDESMIAYYGRHGCKQYIKGKPIRFGYKAWSLCSPGGYMINFEIYQGKNPRSDAVYEERFGTCSAPLLCMIDDFSEDTKKLPFSSYFDNLFTGIPLLTYLKQCSYNATGTIRENRIPKSCPIPHKKDLRKKTRGYNECVKMEETDIYLTKWVDNSVVCLASACYSSKPVGTALRYSKQSHKKITVPRPFVVGEYNKYMSGVDRFDQNVAGSRIGFRGKKWWHCIFTWLIDASLQNSWILYRRTNENKTFLDFKRDIAIYYCKHFGSQPKAFQKPSAKRSASVKNTLRYDRIDHLVIPIEKRRRCAGELCKSVISSACKKCDVGLCLKCFESYHTNPE